MTSSSCSGSTHEYIAPGEYRYCAAGWHLLPSTEPQPCPVCEGQAGAAVYEQALRRSREMLAAERHRLGMAPRFWLG